MPKNGDFPWQGVDAGCRDIEDVPKHGPVKRVFSQRAN